MRDFPEIHPILDRENVENECRECKAEMYACANSYENNRETDNDGVGNDEIRHRKGKRRDRVMRPAVGTQTLGDSLPPGLNYTYSALFSLRIRSDEWTLYRNREANCIRSN